MAISTKKSFLSGFAWTAVQTIGTKLISLGSQVILAWLLLPEDFGKVSIAFAITSMIFIIQSFGMTDALVSRGHMFSSIKNLAKSIALIATVVTIFILFVIAHLAGYIYNDPDIKRLILILIFSVPFNAMSVIPDAKLRIDLKFKDLSIIRLVEFLLSNLLILVLVYKKVGVYSFVIAPIIASIYKYIALHKKSEISYFFKFTLNHWKYLVSNSIYNFFHILFQTYVRQTDYLILGLFVASQSVGLYFMGYSLSVQVVGVLVASLSPIFFPILKKIPSNEKERIRSILLKIITVFTLLGMPFALSQAVLMEYLIILFLDVKWLPSIIIVQILSLGIGFNVSASVWEVAVRLNNDFKKMALYSFGLGIVFTVVTLPMTYLYGTTGMAIAVSIYQIIYCMVVLNGALKAYKIDLKEIVFILFKYFICGVVIYGAVYFIVRYYYLNTILAILLNGLVSPLLFFSILFLVDQKSRIILLELLSIITGGKIDLRTKPILK